jgi:CHAT domain-containing protein
MLSKSLCRIATGVLIALAVLSTLPLHAEEPAAVARKMQEFLAGGDFEAAKRLMADGVSIPEMSLYPGIHRTRCISLAEFQAGPAHIDGDHAELPVVTAFLFDDRAGQLQLIYRQHAHLGMKRSGSTWKIDSWTFEEKKLLDQLMNAASDADADAILAQHPDLFGAALIRELRVSGWGYANRLDMAKTARIAAALHSLADMTADDAALAYAYSMDGMIEHYQTNGDRGLASAEQALAAARRSGNPDVIGVALIGLAHAHQWADGNIARGVPALEEALSLRDRVADESVVSRAAIFLAAHHLERGEYRRVVEDTRLINEIARRTEDPIAFYSVESLLAKVFDDENDFDLAVLHYRRAGELAASAHFTGGVIGMTEGLAHCYLLLGRRKEFRETAEALLKLAPPGEDGIKTEAWGNISSDHFRHHELDDADRAVAQAMRTVDSTAENELRADAYEMLSRIRLAQKKYRPALDAAQKAILNRTKNDTVSQLSPWVLAARAHLALGERAAAYASLRAALRFGETERATAAGTERQIALLFEPAAEAYSMLVDMLVADGRTSEALLVAENAKARTLLDILDGIRSNAEAGAPPAMVAEERRLEKRLTEANTSGDADAIRKARLELESHSSMMAAARPELRAARGAGNLPSIESLAPLLPDGAALVEYVVGEKQLHIFIVQRGAHGPRVDVRSVAVGREALEAMAERYADALAGRDLAYAKDARALYARLLAPVVRAAPHARDLCIIPDGALWRVPFESLIDAGGAFAIEKRAFFYAPSAAVLLRERAHVAASRSKHSDDHLFLGFGNPQLETSRGEMLTASERAVSSAPIPEAAREVETIAQIIGPKSSSIFTGPEALESRAKTEAPRFRIVHLATHGVIDDANPMYSRLLLSRRDGDGEDGVLEAREMFNLRLDADLVVLSACDTARGNVHAGEGLIGMAWALFAAGSPSIIASHWRVGSARTETLMTTFYRDWTRERGTPFAKARALRAARLALLRDPDHRHPYYWSPFVLLGSAD